MSVGIKDILIAVAVILGTHTIIYAHGSSKDHTHHKSELHKASIKNIARLQVKRFVLAKKLERSWNSVTVDKMEKKLFNGKEEWVITFNNTKEADPAKQMLYIFVDIYGEYTGANFTGE